MRQTIDAVYENGVLRPLAPLNLPDHEQVSVIVESRVDESWIDLDALAWARLEGDASISLEDVRRRLAKSNGSLADAVIAERGEY